VWGRSDDIWRSIIKRQEKDKNRKTAEGGEKNKELLPMRNEGEKMSGNESEKESKTAFNTSDCSGKEKIVNAR